MPSVTHSATADLVCFGLDQFLHHEPDRLTDQVDALADAEGLSSSDTTELDNAIGGDSFVTTWPQTPRIPPVAVVKQLGGTKLAPA